MHDAAFARAAVQSPVCVLKLPLRPYSVGHELVLVKEGNPLADPKCWDAATKRHVARAALICSQTWREILAMKWDPLLYLKLKIWDWRIRKEDFSLATADFANYRNEGASFPPSDPPEGAGGRALGSPVLARLIQFLTGRMGLSLEAAHDFPLSLGYWHMATFCEEEGRLRIPNAAEVEFDEWCQEQDRLEAITNGGTGHG